MSDTPQDLSYTPEHEWIDRAAPARVGITHVAVDQLKDIVYVDLPQPGAPLVAGQVCGEVESVKSVAELYSPVSGTVVDANQDVVDAPETINDGPYEAWLFTVDVADGGRPATLLTAAQYDEAVAAAAQ